MGGPKKKNSKGKAPSKPAKQVKAASEAYLEGLQHLTPQEHVAAVKPLWETLDEAERLKLLTVPLDDLTTYAKEQAARAKAVADAEAAEALRLGHVIVSLEPPVDEVLEEGLARSRERGTWKVWHWAPEDMQCYDSDTFRKFLHEKVLTEEQLSVLPRDDPSAKIPERPAEAAFRQRMVDLITRISEQRVAHEEAMMARQKAGIAASTGRRGAADPQTAFRDIHIDLVTSMLSALEHEHESVYHHCLHPVCAYVCDMLPEDARKSTRTDLHYEDLESLLPDDVTRIYEFLTEKVDALSSKLRAEAKELEAEAGELDDEPIGDVDLFSLVDDGAAIRVNDKWLYHLQSRVLSEDGQPRRAKPEEDPKRLGLVLEWVYGTIVSTAEKARDAARRSLASQPPSPELAVDALVGALNEQTMWEARAKESRELLAQMLASRKEMAELAEKHDMRAVTPPPRGPAAAAAAREGEPAAPADANGDGSAPSPELPDHVYITVLKREALLTAAKLHFLSYEHQAAQRNLRSLTAQLRQGEPQFERLKRELDEVKAAPSRSLEGTYRTTAEMERARKQLADAAIEEQIHVQAALRQTGTRLQKIVETRGEVEMALRSRDAEMGQLSNWRAKVLNLVKAYEAAMAAAAPLQHATAAGEVDEEGGEVDEAQRALIAAVKSATRQEEELQRLRSQFRTDVRHQLYSSEDDLVIFSNIKRQLKDVEQRLETGRVALQHLEAFVLNVACDDPGIVISSHLILPFLQQRLDTKALEFAAQRAAAALDEVMQMELEDADRQRQEKEKKAKAKLKAKEKLRMEKEKERADREAREQAAKAQAEEEARAAAAREEEEKRRRAQEVEELRRKEEELMERRRAELLAQEGSYWQKRAQQEELIAAQIEIEQELMRQALENGDLAAGGEGEFESAGARAAGRRSKGAKDKDKERQPARERQPRDAKGAGKERAERGEKVAPRKIKSDTKPATAEGPAAVAVVNGISRESSPPLPEAATSPLAPMSPDRPESGVPALPSTPQNASGQPSATLQAEPPLPVAPVAPQGGPPVAGSFPASAGALPPVLPVPVAGPQPPHALPPTVIPIPVGVPLPSGMVAPLPLVTQMPLPPGAIRPPPPPPHVAQPPIVPGQHSRSASADSGSPTRPMPGPQGVPHFPPGSFPPGMGPPMPPHMVYMPPVAPGGAPPQMVDGRMMHPGAPYGPVTAGVLPTMPPPPPPMPGMHPMAMPQMPPPGMGGPRLPAHPRTGPGNGAQPQVPSKQLRAAAQPFVPASFRAPAPPKSAAATTATHPGSPRGILEMPSQTSDVASQGNDEQPTSVHTGSDSGSAAGSTHANGTASHDAQQPSPTTEEPVDGSEGQSNGGFEPQQQEMMRALVNNYKQQQERDTGVVDVTKLRLTRGLTNAPGLYNCFLNVIIQSLWHLPTVRHSFLKLTPPTLKGDVTSGSNANVLRSLWNVFRALEASGDPLEGTSGAAHEGLPLPPVSPRELREALSSTATEAASRFELSDMHDAAEVFGELISRLHAAEAGPGAADPTLPSRVARTGDVLHKPAPRSSAASPSAGSSPPGPGSVWGNSAALKRVRKAPTPVNVKGRTTVVRLFGIEVQVPNSTGGSAPGSSPGKVDALQYVKFCHLVPAKGLRTAAQTAPSFEAALAAASGHSSDELLVGAPKVLALSIVWESPQVPPPVLEATFSALRTDLDASKLFAGQDDALPYRLRCVVCYSSAHYCVFALSEEVGRWLLLNDAEVTVVGGWVDVGNAVRSRRLQPSLLFYEATPVQEE